MRTHYSKPYRSLLKSDQVLITRDLSFRYLGFHSRHHSLCRRSRQSLFQHHPDSLQEQVRSAHLRHRSTRPLNSWGMAACQGDRPAPASRTPIYAPDIPLDNAVQPATHNPPIPAIQRRDPKRLFPRRRLPKSCTKGFQHVGKHPGDWDRA